MRIMFVGDINLGEYYTSFGHGPRSYLQSKDVFIDVKEIFAQADIVVGNLEAPLTNANYNSDDPESMVLRGDPKHAQILQNAGFRVLQVANNHTVQHGPEGFEETLKVLDNNNMKPVGLKGQSLVTFDIQGETIGFLSASDVPDNTWKDQSCYQALDSEFEASIKNATLEVDHLFILLHWGLESSTSVLPYQIDFIERQRQAGVRGVIGAHPHLLYEVWKEKNFVAAPSLGNFVFDLGWDSRLLKSAILDVELMANDINLKIWPLELKDNGCRPTPSGPSIKIDKKISLYNLGKDMSGEQLRKTIYLFKNILKGNSKLKLKFFARKVTKILS